VCEGGYVGRSARAVRAVGPGAREKPTSPTLKNTYTHSTHMAVTPSGKGRGNSKKPLLGGYGKVAEGRRWDIISIKNKFFQRVQSPGTSGLYDNFQTLQNHGYYR
jgi:hypothetical protein